MKINYKQLKYGNKQLFKFKDKMKIILSFGIYFI